MKKLFTLIAILFSGYMASASCSASYSASISGLTVTFTNTSTPPSHPGAMARYANWNFGDGGYSSSWNPSHTYAAAGTYTITLLVSWYDSGTSAFICDDTLTAPASVTVTGGVGISGSIIRDSALGTVAWDSIMVWLITYDTTTHIITAVDSSRIVAYTSSTPYSFSGVAAGRYLLKAAGQFGSSGSGFVPTYHYSSLSWSGGGYVTCSTSTVSGQDIYMQYGTLTSGPGFIGGDITMGAGKGTAVGDPVAGLEIYLINTSTGKLVSATTTDATGNYSFNVPYGTYTIQPEKAGLATTPWSSITVSSVGKTVTGISFKENSTSIKPKPMAVPTVTSTSNIAIYPNPAHDQLSIQWNGATAKTANVTITNVAGQKVFQSSISITGADSKLNIAQLQPGVYFMNINAGELNYNNKITIK